MRHQYSAFFILLFIYIQNSTFASNTTDAEEYLSTFRSSEKKLTFSPHTCEPNLVKKNRDLPNHLQQLNNIFCSIEKKQYNDAMLLALQLNDTKERSEILAHVELARLQQSPTLTTFEQTFNALSSVNNSWLGRLKKNQIIQYAKLCKKAADASSNKTPNFSVQICQAWGKKLRPFLSNSNELRQFDQLIKQPTTSIERTALNGTTYKIDLDLKQFDAGWALYQQKEYTSAYATWRDLLKEYPRTNIKLRTKYWMLKAAKKAGHDSEAETLAKEIIAELPFAYYALLASFETGIDLGRMIDSHVPEITLDIETLPPHDIVRIQRAEEYYKLGLINMAQRELNRVKDLSMLSNQSVSRIIALAHAVGAHLTSFIGLSELSSRGVKDYYSTFGIPHYFPTAWLKDVETGAAHTRVPPLLLISLIKQESAFFSEAVSTSNAFGLTQIIPATARDLKKDIELDELFIPKTSIELSATYIEQLLNRYQGHIPWALAGYNAGPGHADRWRRAAIGLPFDEAFETITFKETREYVQSILRNYYWYRRSVLGERATSLNDLIGQAKDSVVAKRINKRRPNQNNRAPASISSASKKSKR